MSYCILDGRGRFKGDICSTKGIDELESKAGDALAEFLDTGEADAALAEEIKSEVESDLDLKYISKLFTGDAPFVLSGGVDDEDD